MSKPKLTYFDFPGGRGEDCRIALHVAGVEFEDDRVKFPAWSDRKASMPFGALPVLEIPGKGKLGQSNAILRFVGTQHGLHPSDPFQAALSDAIMDSVEDVRGRVNPNPAIEDAAQKKAYREAFASGYLTSWAHQIEAMLGDGPFVGGSNLQVADLKLYMLMNWFISGGVDDVPKDIFAGHKKLTALFDAVHAHPKVADWYA